MTDDFTENNELKVKLYRTHDSVPVLVNLSLRVIPPVSLMMIKIMFES